jgi:hypothetical protein
MRRTAWGCLLAILTLFSSAKFTFAQFSGSITGEVQDPSGSLVPNATLVLTKTDTGERHTAVSNASGV